MAVPVRMLEMMRGRKAERVKAARAAGVSEGGVGGVLAGRGMSRSAEGGIYCQK
jgi:hypothetical protein